jgi:hypothetical protein
VCGWRIRALIQRLSTCWPSLLLCRSRALSSTYRRATLSLPLCPRGRTFLPQCSTQYSMGRYRCYRPPTTTVVSIDVSCQSVSLVKKKIAMTCVQCVTFCLPLPGSVIYIAATPRGRSSLQCNHAVTLLMQQVLRLWLWLFHSQLALTRPNGPIGGILSSTSSASFHFQCQDLGSMHQTCFQMVPQTAVPHYHSLLRSFLTVHLCDAQVLLLCVRAHVVAGRHPQRRTYVCCVCLCSVRVHGCLLFVPLPRASLHFVPSDCV